MHLFYTPDVSGNIYTLNEEESLHCLKVLRLKIGDTIHLTDGKGNLYHCEIIADDHKQCTVKWVETKRNHGRRNFSLHMAVAPTKNSDRFEWFLEKATEIGIDEITPVFCAHSERDKFKHERFEKVMIAAMKQSLKATLPLLHDPVRFKDFMKMETDSEKFIASLNENNKSLKQSYTKGTNALILIGPEGDFSEAEITLAKECNFAQVNMGTNRLRTETAAVVACHTINLMNE